jgi:hypothetical protein
VTVPVQVGLGLGRVLSCVPTDGYLSGPLPLLTHYHPLPPRSLFPQTHRQRRRQLQLPWRLPTCPIPPHRLASSLTQKHTLSAPLLPPKHPQEEAAALEAANVYAMLESTPLVDGVIADLRRTQSILDDLDESLKVSVSLHATQQLAPCVNMSPHWVRLCELSVTSVLACAGAGCAGPCGHNI